MAISEKSTFAGRELTLTWQESDNLPFGKKISQISGYCLTADNKVLIIKNEQGWGLPGGHPEEGETVEQTLRREIAEEADAVISEYKLFGYVEVNDPENNSIEGRDYVQLRFICQLEKINDFTASFETSDRQAVAVSDLPDYITWISNSITGQAQYQSFIKKIS